MKYSSLCLQLLAKQVLCQSVLVQDFALFMSRLIKGAIIEDHGICLSSLDSITGSLMICNEAKVLLHYEYKTMNNIHLYRRSIQTCYIPLMYNSAFI